MSAATETHPLVGCTIIDTACVPALRGKILSVSPDGFSVMVSYRTGSFCQITPTTDGRYVVEVPQA